MKLRTILYGYEMKNGYMEVIESEATVVRNIFALYIEGKSLKEIAYGENYFQSLGLKYIGPIDGNDIPTLIKYFTYAKNNSETTVVHIKTKKGFGYLPAQEDKTGLWHSVGKFDVESGQLINNVSESLISWSEGISDIIYKLMAENDKIITLTPAMIKGSRIENIKSTYPNRLVDVGINEELCIDLKELNKIKKLLKASTICIYNYKDRYMLRIYGKYGIGYLLPMRIY